MIITVTDASFSKDVLAQSMPVLVDFWAPWCGPCRMLAPELEELAKHFEGKMIVAKINVEENRMTPGQYRVEGIPSVKLFQNGKVITEFIGYQPADMFIRELEKIIPNNNL